MKKWFDSGSRRHVKAGALGLVFVAAAWLGGCNGGGGEDRTTGFVSGPAGTTVPIVVNAPAQIAQESADDYNDNVNGLITGATLQNWIDDWQNNRPAGITGRLIVMQINGPSGAGYVTPKPAEGVLSYRLASSRLTMDRSNGVITTRSMVPDGPTMDTFLSDFGINPLEDLVVCAMGTGGTSAAMSQGRCWYMMRYWGVPKANVAALSGGTNSALVMDPSYISATATCDENVSDACLPRSGYVSVRNLREDNTALLADVEDMIDVVEGRASGFMWDARNQPQYLGNSFQNNGSRQGHPLGAYQLEFTNFLMISDGSFRYKDKASLEAYMNGETVDGANFVYYDSGAAVPTGVGNAYQGGTVYTYCETTFRAMITGFASAAILGLPTRFYDGAMVEWNSLSHIQDQNGQFILPADSPWRTDLVNRSVFNYSVTTIAPRIIDDPYAAHADAITVADKAYKQGGGSGSGSGGSGGALPPNPCGG